MFEGEPIIFRSCQIINENRYMISHWSTGQRLINVSVFFFLNFKQGVVECFDFNQTVRTRGEDNSLGSGIKW